MFSASCSIHSLLLPHNLRDSDLSLGSLVVQVIPFLWDMSALVVCPSSEDICCLRLLFSRHFSSLAPKSIEMVADSQVWEHKKYLDLKNIHQTLLC